MKCHETSREFKGARDAVRGDGFPGRGQAFGWILNEEREQKWTFQGKETGLERAKAQKYKAFCGAGAEA